MRHRVRLNRFLPVLLGLTILGLWYGINAFKVPINYADSDDLTMAAYFGGLAHPPGYPLLVSLLHPWLSQFSPQKSIYLVNLSSSWLTVFNLGLLFFILVNLWQGDRTNITKNYVWWVAAVAVMGVGLWRTVVWHARIIEVFPLAQLLILAVILLVQTANRGAKHRFRYAFWIGGLSLLAVAHQPLSILLLTPTLGYYLWQKHQKMRLLAGLLIGALVGILIFGGLFEILAQKRSEYSWPVGQGFQGRLDFWWRRVYTQAGSAVELDVKTIDLKHSLKSVFIWCQLWFQDIYGWGGLFMVFGGIWLYMRQKKEFWWIIISLILAGVFLAAYHKFPLQNNNSELAYFWGTQIRWRMQFVAMIPAAMLFGTGWYGLAIFLREKFKSTKFRMGLFMLPVVLILGSAYKAWKADNFNTEWYRLSQQQAQDVLNSMPVGAQLLVDSDQVFAMILQQKLFKVRPDINLAPLRFDLDRRHAFTLNLPFEQITTEDEAVEKVVELIDRYQAVFLYSPSANLLKFLGVEGNPFFAAPYGYTLKIMRQMPQINMALNGRTSVELMKSETQIKSKWLNGFRANLAFIHSQLMYYWTRLGYPELAKPNRISAEKLSQFQKSRDLIKESADLAEWARQNHNSYANYAPAEAEQFLNKLKVDEVNQVEQWQYLISRVILIDPYQENYYKLLPSQAKQ